MKATFYFTDGRDPIIFEEDNLKRKLRAVLATLLIAVTHDRIVVNAERTFATALAVGILRAAGVIH